MQTSESGGAAAPVREPLSQQRGWRGRRVVARNQAGPGSATLALMLSTTLAALAAPSVLAQTPAEPAASSGAPLPAPEAAQLAFDLAAQSLVSALGQFGQQSGLQVLFNEAEVAGRQSQAVQGRMLPREALARLLAGSGVDIASERASGFVLKVAPRPSGAATGERTLAPVTVTARPEHGLSTEGTGAYTSRGVSLGKIEQDLKEIPQSVTVLSRQLIDDQHLVNLNELMAQAPGIVVVKDNSAYLSYYARGFRIDNYQVDGVGVRYGSIYRPDFDLAIYDRVELLRGAEGLFSAAGDPSGSINLVRKRPTEAWQGSASVSYGSWQNRRVEADVSGPLAWEGRLRGRLVAAHQDRNFFYSPSDEKKTVRYGVLEADLSPSTLLRAGFSQQKLSGTAWLAGLPTFADGGDVGVARNRALTTRWAHRDQTIRETFATLEQGLGQDWTARLSVTRQRFDVDGLNFSLSGPIDRAARRFALISASGTINGNHADTVDLGVSGHFNLWGRRHQLVAGLDWRKSEAVELGRYADGSYADVTLDSDLSGSGLAPPTLGGISGGWPGYGAEQKGIYAKLQLQASEALRLIVGGRYGSFKHDEPMYRYDRDGMQTEFVEYRYRDNSIFTPYAGLVFDLGRNWAAYASVTEIYLPQSNYRAGPPEVSRPLDPIDGRNYEVGIKGSLLDARVNTSVALYRIERTGEAAEDPAYPSTPVDLGNTCCYLAQGKIVSQGLDVELSGELAPGWRVFAGYTWNQNQNRETHEVFHAVTPRHQFKLWTAWQLPARLSAWTLGGGVTAQSRQANQGLDWVYREGSGWDQAPFAIRQGGYAVWNASVDYRVNRNWSLALNMRNLFDRHYYQTLGTARSGNWYGEPRSAMLSLRGSF